MGSFYEIRFQKMRSVGFCGYFYFFCSLLLFLCNLVNGTTFLKAATVIFRHGERNPIRTYPTDPYENATLYWPEGYGSMTQNGKLQVYELGQYLKLRYPNVSPENVVAYSSDRNRTLSSANLLLDGYFSKGSGYKGNVKIIPIEKDDFIFVSQPCPKYFELRDSYRKERNLDLFGGWKKEVEIISHHTGMSFDSVDLNLFFFTDTILVQKSRNLTLPPWAEKLYKEGAIHGIKSFYYTSSFPTPEVTKLLTGAMVSRFIASMDQILELDNKLGSIDLDPTLTLISGHDTTIAFWLTNLDLVSSIEVPFAAALLLELHQGLEINGRHEFYIKVLYKRDAISEPEEVKLPRCPKPCRYSDFKIAMQSKSLLNREENCRVDATSEELVVESEDAAEYSEVPPLSSGDVAVNDINLILIGYSFISTLLSLSV